MKFGHYSNAELGINRNLTCAMFDSKGVGVGDVQCSTQPLTGQPLRKHLEDLFCRSIGYCRNGRVDWHDYIADYVNEFESDGSTAKANNVLTQFDVEAKQILQKVQTKGLPAGTDMQEAWVQMKSIIANNRAALKRELRGMRMSNEIDDAKDIECFTVQELAREKDKEVAVYHALDAFKYDDPGEYIDDIKTEKDLAKAQRQYERDIQKIYEIANRNLQALQKEAETKGATSSKKHYVWLAGELKKQYEQFQRFTQRAYKEKLAELKSAKTMSNDIDNAKDIECASRWKVEARKVAGLPSLKKMQRELMRSVDEAIKSVRAYGGYDSPPDKDGVEVEWEFEVKDALDKKGRINWDKFRKGIEDAITDLEWETCRYHWDWKSESVWDETDSGTFDGDLDHALDVIADRIHEDFTDAIEDWCKKHKLSKDATDAVVDSIQERIEKYVWEGKASAKQKLIQKQHAEIKRRKQQAHKQRMQELKKKK